MDIFLYDFVIYKKYLLNEKQGRFKIISFFSNMQNETK